MIFQKIFYWKNYALAQSSVKLGAPIPWCQYCQDKDCYLNLTQWLECVYIFAMIIALGLATVVIIYGGYRYIASQGNPDEIEAAKNTITGAIIGVVILILARLILQTINLNLVR